MSERRVCGWEPNGGFLTGSNIERNGAILTALLTRDATLPILAVLFAAAESGLSLVELFARLPKRFSRAALLRQFPRPAGLKILTTFAADQARLVYRFRNWYSYLGEPLRAPGRTSSGALRAWR